jgi:AMME syndrome candidate gene 1 protein
MEQDAFVPVETLPQKEATKAMCFHCFDILANELKRTPSLVKRRALFKHSALSAVTSASSSSSGASTPSSVADLPLECPMFVTWEKQSKRSSSKYELRGCIGTLSPKPLSSSLGEYAYLSAMKDKRFDPIDRHELPHLRVSVSLLVNYEECDGCYDWTVGMHGIIIRFYASDAVERALSTSSSSGGSELSATFLPEVAQQQGWDTHMAVESLIRKAGYKGKITDRLISHIQCTRYESSKEKVNFDEYLAHLGHDATSLSFINYGDNDDTSSSTNCCIM